MKQIISGQKLQNWYRPLGRDELKHRYVQRRHDDASYHGSAPDFFSTGTGEAVVEEEVSRYSPWDDENWDSELSPYMISRLLEDIFEPVYSRDIRKGKLNSAKIFQTVESKKREGWDIPVCGKIENRVFEYIQRIRKPGKNLDVLATEIIGIADNIKDLETIQEIPENSRSCHFIKNIWFFAPFWLRSPHTCPQKDVSSLLRHVFAVYDVPEFLDAVWQEDPTAGEMKWIAWFIIIGQGGSLKRAARQFGWIIPGKFQHNFLNVPPGIELIEACTFAKIKCMGGSATDCERIMADHSYVTDVTWDSSGMPRDIRSWEETVNWMIANKNEISTENASMILAWARHQFIESRYSWGCGFFTMHGRSVRGVLASSLLYRDQVLNIPGMGESNTPDNWKPQGWNWTKIENRQKHWSFVELTTKAELDEEGRKMRHCVGSYAQFCASGRSAIVALRLNGQPILTIEVNCKSRTCNQAMGMMNRPANEVELNLVKEWILIVVNEKSEGLEQIKFLN